MVYFSKEALNAFKHHKYSGKDDSILYNYVLSHWWTYLIRFVPIWMAPNMITLIGTLAVFISYGVVRYYCPDFGIPQGTPSWVYLLCSFCLLFYQTMDNLDGKQARRTQSSSPLGQLFDHGCDSLVTTIQALIAATIAGFGMNWIIVILLISAWCLFWLSTWEEYHTGTLHLGYINGPEEGIVSLALFFAATYWTGAEYWVTSYKKVFQLSGEQYQNLPDFPMFSFMLAASLIPIIVTSIIILRKVFAHLVANGGDTQAAVDHLLTFTIFSGCAALWYAISPEVWHAYPQLIMCTLGLAFGEMVSRLICAHMANNEKVDVIQRVHIPLFIVLAVTLVSKYLGNNFVLKYQVWIVALFVVPIFSSYVHFAGGVISELTTFFNIKVFRISRKVD